MQKNIWSHGEKKYLNLSVMSSYSPPHHNLLFDKKSLNLQVVCCNLTKHIQMGVQLSSGGPVRDVRYSFKHIFISWYPMAD